MNKTKKPRPPKYDVLYVRKDRKTSILADRLATLLCATTGFTVTRPDAVHIAIENEIKRLEAARKKGEAA